MSVEVIMYSYCYCCTVRNVIHGLGVPRVELFLLLPFFLWFVSLLENDSCVVTKIVSFLR